MKNTSSIVKAIAITLLIAICIGALVVLFRSQSGTGSSTRPGSIVSTRPNTSEPEVNEVAYLDIVLYEDIENYQHLNVEQPDNYTVILDGYTNYDGWNWKPFAFIVDLSDLYSKYGEGYYVLSYEIIYDENTTPYKFYINGDSSMLMSEEPSVFELTKDNIQISFETFDPGVQDLVVKFKAMYVSQEYIETANLG